MNKEKITLWGRDFDLDVLYQNYPDEMVDENQEKTLTHISLADFAKARNGVESYILKNYSFELDGNSLDNIFRFVMPKRILIPKSNGKEVFAIMCDFKLDMEHGIAVVFENSEFKVAGPQDIIL